MKATLSLCAVFVTALALSACGGGGDGSGSTSTPTSSAPVTASTSALQGLTFSPITLSAEGITIPFSGPLDPAKTTVDVTVGGIQFNGTVTFSNNNQNVTFKPTVRLPFGESVTEIVTTIDSFGRPMQATVTFTTSAMTCADNARFSNPAVFSVPLQNCDAPIGVQSIVTSLNVMTDNSCTITIGTPLSSSCRIYMANGTMLINDTSIVVNGHAVKWMAYKGKDDKSNTTLLDTNDPNATPVPLGALVLSGNLLGIIGNPTGESIIVTTAVNGVNKTELVTWNASSSSLVVTCLRNC